MRNRFRFGLPVQLRETVLDHLDNLEIVRTLRQHPRADEEADGDDTYMKPNQRVDEVIHH